MNVRIVQFQLEPNPSKRVSDRRVESLGQSGLLSGLGHSREPMEKEKTGSLGILEREPEQSWRGSRQIHSKAKVDEIIVPARRSAALRFPRDPAFRGNVPA